MSYDINPKKPWDITVGINTIATGRTHVLTIGTKIPGTSWVLKGFAKKDSPLAEGTTEDRSEITVEDVATKEAVNIPWPERPTSIPQNSALPFRLFPKELPRSRVFPPHL